MYILAYIISPLKYNIPEKAVQVSELLKNPNFIDEVMLYGQVSAIGQLDCQCFLLSSGDKTVSIWYSSAGENSLSNLDEIKNGDTIGVIGHLDNDSVISIPPKFIPTTIWKIYPLVPSKESPPLKSP